MAGRRRLARRIRAPFEWLADRHALMRGTSGALAAGLRRSRARIDWTEEGRDSIAAEVAAGQPIILICWHGRLAFSPWMWAQDWGPIRSVTSAARPGRIVGATLARFGWQTAPMHDRTRNAAASLAVARLVQKGVSLGFAPDGPLGPARRMKSVPLDWARLTGLPIWLYAGSANPVRHLPTWDLLAVPLAGGRGHIAWWCWGLVVLGQRGEAGGAGRDRGAAPPAQGRSRRADRVGRPCRGA